eukprot:2522366-Rhodomonas_salina.3
MVLGYLEQLDVVYADGEAMLLLRASVRYVDELRQAVGVMPITAQRQTSDTSVSQANANDSIENGTVSRSPGSGDHLKVGVKHARQPLQLRGFAVDFGVEPLFQKHVQAFNLLQATLPLQAHSRQHTTSSQRRLFQARRRARPTRCRLHQNV